MKAARETVYSLNRTLSHNFVIGPLSEYGPLRQTGRLYYCTHCKWSFLVCGRKVAVLDDDGQAITGEESLRRFQTFVAGPCPVLETLMSDAFFGPVVPVSSCNGAERRGLDRGHGSSAWWRLAHTPFDHWLHRIIS
jgi:hypothetical protein